ncbi:MAG TPA: GNAT family N-acetyltransferase [Bacilli bacterium]
MQIRSFRLSDYAAVTQVLQEVLSEGCFAETIEALGRQLAWNSDLILVAVDNGAVIGVIIGTIDNNHGYYYRIAVASQHQRKGVGKALIQALRVRFENRRVRKVMVTVDRHNEPILPLYEKLGFRVSDFLDSSQKLSIVNG